MMTDVAAQNGPCLESNRHLRIFTVFLLYAGQGIPIGLFDFAIPAWMAVNGASAKEIGFLVAMTGIPWSFKFFAGFIIDRYTMLSMGRRRAWIIGAQALMMFLLILFAVISPGPRDVLILGLVALAVNTAVVFQDVATDGLTVDIIPEEERSFAGALSSGGQVVGIAASAALTGLMVRAFGASAAYLACATLVAVVNLHVISVRERFCERRLPWSPGEAHRANVDAQVRNWLPLAKNALRNTLSPLSLILAPALIARGMVYGLCVIAVPLIATRHVGWTEDRIGSLTGTAQLVAGISTIAIGSLIAAKFGAQRALLFSVLGLIALAGWMWTSSPHWADPMFIMAFIFGWTVIYFWGGVGEAVIIMRMSPPSIAATQYSIFMALHNMGISLAGIMVGAFAYFAEPKAMLELLVAVQVLSAAILFTVKFPTRRIDAPLAPVVRKPALAEVRS